MIFVLDNYDSFTFNLVQELGAQGARVEVARNDRIGIAEIQTLGPRAVVISPGPGRPEDAGISLALVRWCAEDRVPLLGVCLGHQALAVAFGGRVVAANQVMHGKTSMVRHGGEGVLAGLPDAFEATRYHSLVVEEASLPGELVVTARADDGTVMALAHRELPLQGVQFHPESVLTTHGPAILANLLTSCGEPAGAAGEPG